MNLIITCARHLEPETEEELIDILEEFGVSSVKTKKSGKQKRKIYIPT